MGERSEADALLKWLEESGLALELRVMRAFRQHAQVRHAVYYADREGGKPREMDLVARFHGSRRRDQNPQLDVVVECKTGKPGSQWVAFRDEWTRRVSHDEDAWVTAAEPSTKRRFAHAWEWEPPFTERVNVSSIVTAHDGRDTVHGAVQQLLSAVAGQIGHVRRHEEKPVSRFNESTGEDVAWSALEAGVIGIVITTVPLYVADLGEDNAPRVTPVELVAVPTGWQERGGPGRVFVAHETALQRVVTDLHKAAERL
jgi:hypothetical protein